MITVVGAGIIGLCTAFELADRGEKVQIFDPHPTSGATRFAGGMLAPIAEVQFQQDLLFPLMLQSAQLYPDLIARVRKFSDLDTGYDTNGTLVVAADRADAQHLSDLAHYRPAGFNADDIERLTVRAARRCEPRLSPDLAGVVSIPGDHQVYPRLLAAALLDALRNRGVTVVEKQAPETDNAIICTGLGAANHVPLRPVYGDILRLACPTPLVSKVIRGWVNDRAVYIIPRPDGELCIGATSREDSRTRPAVDGVYQLLKDAIRIVPGIEECELIEASVGARPGSPDDLPFFGWLSGTHQLLSTGYFRHGILLAALAGKTAAEVYLGAEIPAHFRACDPYRFSQDP